MSNFRIIHANANTLVRAGLKTVLMQTAMVNKLFEVDSETDLFASIEKNNPQLIIIDYDQPGHFSAKNIFRIRNIYPLIKILVISSGKDHRRILNVLEHGVQGYLTRECDEFEITNALHSMMRGEKFYCKKIINIILDKKLCAKEQQDCDPAVLSDRETEIVILIAKGMTNKEIAGNLFISPHTVHTHRKNIMKKLSIKSASGLVLYAVNAGLIHLEN